MDTVVQEAEDVFTAVVLDGTVLVHPDDVVIHGGTFEPAEAELLREVARQLQLSESASGIDPVSGGTVFPARVT